MFKVSAKVNFLDEIAVVARVQRENMTLEENESLNALREKEVWLCF